MGVCLWISVPPRARCRKAPGAEGKNRPDAAAEADAIRMWGKEAGLETMGLGYLREEVELVQKM